MAQLRIGTCSWKYDSWKGLVYSDTRYPNYLEEYSKMFDTVEVDQWFWSLHAIDKITLPRPDVVEEYSESVPEDFKFSVKMPNSITLTHFYKKSKSDPLMENPHFFSIELYEQFIKSIKPLNSMLGPLIYQFEYLNKQKMASQKEFQIQAAAFFEGVDKNRVHAVEIRNPNYLNDSYFEFLNENGLNHVFLQGYYMPSILDIYSKFGKHIRGTTVIRLHGPDRKGIEEKSGGQWNKIIEPKNEELDGTVDMIKDLLDRDIDVYMNVNNHYEGSAPLTIDKIKGML